MTNDITPAHLRELAAKHVWHAHGGPDETAAALRAAAEGLEASLEREVVDARAMRWSRPVTYDEIVKAHLEKEARTRDEIEDILTALTAAGLRVIAAEPSDEDVERVARGIFAHEWKVSVAEIEAQHPHEWKSMRDYWTAHARAALRAFLNGGGDE